MCQFFVINSFFSVFEYIERKTMNSDTVERSSENKLSKEENEQGQNEQGQKEQGSKASMIVIMIVVGIWVLLGLAAFFASLICFGYSGSTSEKVIGFLLAIFFGPFYWIYFILNKNYCGQNSNVVGGNAGSVGRNSINIGSVRRNNTGGGNVGSMRSKRT